MISLVLAAILGAADFGLILFLFGRLSQQRAQVLDMRKTNVELFQKNQNLASAYNYLQAQVEKIQSGPVAATISFDQIKQIAEVVSATIDFKTINGTDINKKLKN
jgi:hypothetical protein